MLTEPFFLLFLVVGIENATGDPLTVTDPVEVEDVEHKEPFARHRRVMFKRERERKAFAGC